MCVKEFGVVNYKVLFTQFFTAEFDICELDIELIGRQEYFLLGKLLRLSLMYV
jgi:hypothetical protein